MAKTYFSSLWLVIVFTFAVKSYGQDDAIQIDRFEPVGSPSSVLNIHNTHIASHNVAQLSLLTHYSHSPYTLSINEEVVSRPIEHRLTSELAGSISLFENFEIGLVVPLIFQQGDIFKSDDYNGLFIGDARITPKTAFLNSGDKSGLGIGFALPIYLPSGHRRGLVGHRQVRVEPKLILDYTLETGTQIALNLGYQTHEIRRINGYGQQNRIRLGLSGDTQFSKLLGVSGAVFSDISPDEALPDTTNSPTLEAIAVLNLDFSERFSSSVGGGIGFFDTIGNPVFRSMVSISLKTVESDDDGDGIVNAEDKCPNEPEDLDAFEDTDGCPELDNDQDGIPDLKDSCTNEAEDLDNFIDSDGCPDPDNDQDGLVDTEDLCPNKSGSSVNKGCPKALGRMGGDNLEISEKIKLASVQIQECQNKLLEREPRAKGKLVLQFTINADGKVNSTKIVESTVHTIFGNCVTETIKRIDFPKKEATVERRFIVDAGN